MWDPPPVGAGNDAVQTVDAPGASALAKHVIAVASVSVTVTGFRRTSPVLVTTKVTFIVEPAGTATPGAVLASSPLMVLTTVIAGRAGVTAYAGSSSVTGGMPLPVAGSMIGCPSSCVGVPDTLTVSRCS